jgi:adenylosuccinate lyase
MAARLLLHRAYGHASHSRRATQRCVRLMPRTYNCATMNLSSLTAISPLDGRYAAKPSALRPI